MGYRYKNAGYNELPYIALVEVGGREVVVCYRSVFRKNQFAHFCDIRRIVDRVFGVWVDRKNVIKIEVGIKKKA